MPDGGPEHELNWFKIPYWLKGDEETRQSVVGFCWISFGFGMVWVPWFNCLDALNRRAIVHNMKQHFIDEMNAKVGTGSL